MKKKNKFANWDKPAKDNPSNKQKSETVVKHKKLRRELCLHRAFTSHMAIAGRPSTYELDS